MAILLDAGAPAFAERVPSPSPAATSYTLALAADRRSAERNETITYTIWLNVSGGGSLQLVSVNFSVDPDLILIETAITLPFACGMTSSNTTFAGWQCSFLRSGRSYRFGVPVVVDANATRGRSRIAVAQAIELGGGPATPRIALVRVWIVIGVLALQVGATPSSPPVWGSRITFRSEEHTSELQSRENLVCRLLLEKKNTHPLRRPSRGRSRDIALLRSSSQSSAAPTW